MGEWYCWSRRFLIYQEFPDISGVFLFLWMPSLCILDSSVFGLMPKISAAPSLPLTRPRVVFKASIMRRFSTSSRVPDWFAADRVIFGTSKCRTGSVYWHFLLNRAVPEKTVTMRALMANWGMNSSMERSSILWRSPRSWLKDGGWNTILSGRTACWITSLRLRKQVGWL